MTGLYAKKKLNVNTMSLWCFQNIVLFEYPNLPDNSNIDSTSGVNLGRGYLTVRPMAEEWSVWEICW